MTLINRVRLLAAQTRIGARELALVVGTSLPALAFAQGDPFATAAADVQEKITEYGGTLVAVAAVAIAFFVAIKYLKKIVGAS